MLSPNRASGQAKGPKSDKREEPVAVVVDLEGERKKKPSLDRLRALVNDDLKAVNDLIVRKMDSPVVMIPQLAGHLVFIVVLVVGAVVQSTRSRVGRGQ